MELVNWSRKAWMSTENFDALMRANQNSTPEPRIEYQEAYLNDAVFNRVVRMCVDAGMKLWADTHDSRERERAQHAVTSHFVTILGCYQEALRKENRELRLEVTRLKRLVIEPMSIKPEPPHA